MPPVPAFDRPSKIFPALPLRSRRAGSAVGRAALPHLNSSIPQPALGGGAVDSSATGGRWSMSSRRPLEISAPRRAPHARARGSRKPRALLCSAGRAPCALPVPRGGARPAGAPSAHLDVSGRAPAVKPQGLDCRRHAAADDSPVCGWGSPLHPPPVELYQPSPLPSLCPSIPSFSAFASSTTRRACTSPTARCC